MKVVYAVVALVVIVAAVFGAYLGATRSQSEKRSSQAEPVQVVSTRDVEDLRGWAESKFKGLERRVVDLEILAGRLQKETDSLKSSLESKAVKPSDASPPQQEGAIAREGIREEVKSVMDEREKQRRERMFEENQRRYIEFTQRRLDRITQNFGWDEQKKQTVAAIIAEQQQEVRKLLEAARDEGAITPEAREALAEKVRQVNAATMEKLRAVLTPEEAQEVERAFGASRGFRGPMGVPPPSGENTPPEPEPGQ
jgi:hypothetical protein